MAPQQGLKPQFFVTRQNGAMVPLIAMDELPVHVQIEGVSRSLGAFDTAGMTGVGVREARHQYYVVQRMNNTMAIPFNGIRTPQTPISNASKPNSASSTPLLRAATLSSSLIPNALHVGNQLNEVGSTSGVASTNSTKEDIKPATNPLPGSSANVTLPPTTTTTLAWRNKAEPILANDAPPADPDPEMPPVGQKVYCSYWLRNGECNFAQQGCMFKHVMPLKLEVLEVLGFRDLPDWYRKTYKVGSLRVNGGRDGLSYGILDGNKAAPRARRVGLDAEATRRIIASHINALPLGNGRGGRHHHHGDRQRRASGNHYHRPLALSAPRTPAVVVAGDNATDKVKAKANEKERRDELLAAAFAADMDSELEDMMDARMEKIREQEQAGWEEEQEAAKEAAKRAATAEAGKKGGETGGAAKKDETLSERASGSGKESVPIKPVAVGDRKKHGGRGGVRYPRRKKTPQVPAVHKTA
ncbi:uncharacterized protein Z519_09742 [Cladophialophora bantiana CBS 173.52]|uniref:C3H1-type domain-containing protein n=1 Tax=Cladophialophora bantiana (strain ATCC 10958 / CBS 173.52 / CDC B-1940 / NIH 8579) TaxID=1442370 RepID=A0A0D2EHQ5_CLAB1|nr:uncharacterized protein Z519_09742 [Cladophialophora bantiana CBS 173.52]KIW89586.1 hypothetical protein Z519_09742 [Cladophialophora bantiana CBS 173.52]